MKILSKRDLLSYRFRDFAIRIALHSLGAAAAMGQTIFSGSYSASGTRTDCNVSGTPASWTEIGTVTVTLMPAFGSLPPSGGSVSGTFTMSGTNSGCKTPEATSAQGTVAGSVSASGAVMLTQTASMNVCTVILQGTESEVSGALPSGCWSSPKQGSGSMDLTSRSAAANSGSAPACAPFPSGLIPFTSISYVTAANYAGDHLVVGAPSPGLLDALANLALPAFTNQTFCDSQVQLAPGQYYPSVYVPTADESGGNFGAFAGLLVNPVNNLPYPNGVIPSGQLGAVFAWRIGAAQTSAQPNWTATGSLSEPMSFHAAVLLPSGKVLVLSGYDTVANLYDPATGTFSQAGQMVFQHGAFLTATLLNDGRVLIEGGAILPSAAEIYDPTSGQFTATGSTVQPHSSRHTATRLNDGRVLIVGGTLSSNAGASTLSAGAELFDPQIGKFTAAGPMSTNRNAQTATLLKDGRVLIAGGFINNDFSTDGLNVELNSAEVYDPSTGSFSPTSSMAYSHGAHTAVLLPSGLVLVAGGSAVSTAELFDPETLSFRVTGSLSSNARANSQIALLASGQALVMGGLNAAEAGAGTDTAELYSPALGTFTPAGNMQSSRVYFTATVLPDGRVLAVGGAPRNGAGATASAEIYTPTVEGLVTSQSGLTFQFAQGNSTAQSQSVAVLSTTATIPWNVSTHTYEGGNWLSVSTTSGNSVPGGAPTTLTITANPSGLSAQTYYGSVTLTPTDGVHPPVTIAIVLNIVPAGASAPPIVSPSGIVLTGSPGSTLAPQTFTISNLTSLPISFTAAGSNTPLFFNVTPSAATIPAAQSATLKITPTLAGLTAGAYKGTITLTFGDGSTQIVQLLLVLSPGASSSNASVHRLATSTCTPTKLLPIFTSIGSGFSVLAAWPISIIVEVVDDCANAINTGSVIVSFSDGDPPIGLISTGDGRWAGTWVPQNNAPGLSARADAQQSPLTGTVQITGGASSNPTVPVISAGGVVSSGDFASPPAQGLLVSIFGSGLADSAVGGTLPLDNQIGSTQVLLGNELLPLLYASDTLINVLIPYDVALNTTEELVVQRASAISVPVKTAVFSAAPSILSTNGTGSGQGHIYVIGDQGQETLADQNAPATAGNNIVIYCIGLGAVNPAVVGGSIAPSTPPAQTTLPVSVTFGGVTAAAAFAGLTPGEAGLYQINLTIPPGVPTGQVPVTISAGAASSSSSIYMAIQ